MSEGPAPVRLWVRYCRALVRWWPLAVCVAAIALVTRQAIRFDWKLDDAYITFAYAQNWVQGHGLVFNVGERVEGYTCFLWVVLCAAGMALGANIEQWSTWLGIASASATVVCSWRLARALVPARAQNGAVTAAVLVAGYPAVAWWAASGMETLLFTCLLTASMWRHVRDGATSIAAPVCLALASMTRPEAWLLAAVLCLDVTRKGPWRRAVRYVALFVIIFAPYYGWRFWYYGYPVPNTFYAKVGGTSAQVMRGIEYLHTFMTQGGGAVLVVPAVCALWSGVGRRAAALYVFLLTYLAYVVLVGGDVFFFYRFLVPVVPVMAALAVAGILRLSNRLWPARPLISHAFCAVYTAGFALICLTLYQAEAKDLRDAQGTDAIAHGICQGLKADLQPGDAIATVGIGVMKFCTGRQVIDMVGLTDKHIAHQAVPTMGQGFAGHEKFDSAYVLARWPAYFVIPKPGYYPKVDALYDMWQQPMFKQYYIEDRFGYRRIGRASIPARPE